jgi:hypothetical protein
VFVIDLRDIFDFSVVQTVMAFERIGWVWVGLVLVRLGWVGLGWVGSTVGKICFVFDFILHTAYTVDACALTSILHSLSLIDMMYCTADTKETPASVQGVGVDF